MKKLQRLVILLVIALTAVASTACPEMSPRIMEKYQSPQVAYIVTCGEGDNVVVLMFRAVISINQSVPAGLNLTTEMIRQKGLIEFKGEMNAFTGVDSLNTARNQIREIIM